MRVLRARFWRSIFRDEAGQVLPIVALGIVVLLGMTGVAVDISHAYLCQRELQATCDAAALAGATVIPTSLTSAPVIKTATNYTALPGAKNNIYTNMSNVAMVSGYPALKCLATMQAQGISCVGYLPYNALQVRMTATVPTYFAKILGQSSITISASSTAAKGGGSSRPYNIVVMIDTTGSMAAFDADCGNTQLNCVLNGVQVLLRYLDPCGTSQATCTFTQGNAANSVVRVSLFTFPQMTYLTAKYDSDCSSGNAYDTAYTFPPIGGTSYMPGTASNSVTYRVLDFQSDYRVSDTATVLNSNSLLTHALGAANGCPSMYVATNTGQFGTYYAPPMYAAQAALIQERTANPGTENVMIVLGDGDATAPQSAMDSSADASGSYPSYLGECGQAIDAARFATSQGTTVYSVAYGSPAVGCKPDINAGSFPNISPCNEMSLIASHSWDFFSDYKLTGSGSTCTAAQTMVSLNNIFLQIAGDLTVARLIPDNTT